MARAGRRGGGRKQAACIFRSEAWSVNAVFQQLAGGKDYVRSIYQQAFRIGEIRLAGKEIVVEEHNRIVGAGPS